MNKRPRRWPLWAERKRKSECRACGSLNVDATRGVGCRENELIGIQKSAWYRDGNRVEVMGTREQSSNEDHLHFEAIYTNYWKSLIQNSFEIERMCMTK